MRLETYKQIASEVPLAVEKNKSWQTIERVKGVGEVLRKRWLDLVLKGFLPIPALTEREEIWLEQFKKDWKSDEHLDRTSLEYLRIYLDAYTRRRADERADNELMMSRILLNEVQLAEKNGNIRPVKKWLLLAAERGVAGWSNKRKERDEKVPVWSLFSYSRTLYLDTPERAAHADQISMESGGTAGFEELAAELGEERLVPQRLGFGYPLDMIRLAAGVELETKV